MVRSLNNILKNMDPAIPELISINRLIGYFTRFCSTGESRELYPNRSPESRLEALRLYLVLID